MTTKHDPLEAAKVTDASRAADDQAAKPWMGGAPQAAEKPTEKPEPPAGTPMTKAERKAAEKAAREAKASTPDPLDEVDIEVEVAAAPELRFRVVEDKQISWQRTITLFRKGSVIKARHYGGQVGIDRLVAAGVKLEPVA